MPLLLRSAGSGRQPVVEASHRLLVIIPLWFVQKAVTQCGSSLCSTQCRSSCFRCRLWSGELPVEASPEGRSCTT